MADKSVKMEVPPDTDDPQEDGTRQTRENPRPTEKGLAYAVDRALKSYNSARLKARANTEHVRSRMLEDLPKAERQLLYSHWVKLQEVAIAAGENYNELSGPEQVLCDVSSEVV